MDKLKYFDLISKIENGGKDGWNASWLETQKCKRCGYQISGKSMESCGSNGDNWIEPLLELHIENHFIKESEPFREYLLNNWTKGEKIRRS